MRLSQLIQGLPATFVVRSDDPEIRRIVSDSRRVRRGDAFCAIAGHEADGHKFIDAAIAAGAAAIFAQQAGNGARQVAPGVSLVTFPDTRRALAVLAHRCLGDPTRQMTVVGVTGTKGKTTTTYLLESIFHAAGLPCGVLGTIAYRWGAGRIFERPNHVTTPGADELAEMFAAMLADGVRHVAMEVSSHALDQGRVDAIDFDAAIFTNLSGDHRDYHPTTEHYLGAKAKLFENLRPDAAAIINAGADYACQIAERSVAPVTWYGLSDAAMLDAADTVAATIQHEDAAGTRFLLSLPGESALPVRLPLIGRHNIYNSLAAAGAAFRVGVAPRAIVAGLESLRAVPGRLESVRLPDGRPSPVAVLVDYAHTDDSLDNALRAVRPLATGHKLICVFGCGGDRDVTKRPRMAAVAARLADRVFVTSDNPRTENAEAIIDQIMAGFADGDCVRVTRITDRREAIDAAIAVAAPGDVVLLAGKGHEDYQIIGRQKIHFDDREVAAEALGRRFC